MPAKRPLVPRVRPAKDVQFAHGAQPSGADCPTFRQWCQRHDRLERAVLYCRQEGIEVTMP